MQEIVLVDVKMACGHIIALPFDINDPNFGADILLEQERLCPECEDAALQEMYDVLDIELKNEDLEDMYGD